MTKDQRIHQAKMEIQERLIRAVFDQLVATHTEAMERSIGEIFFHDKHAWVISKIGEVWTIRCKGLYDWHVTFETHYRECPIETGVCEISRLHMYLNPIADTVRHLKMAIQFVSEFLATTNVDGSIRKE